MPVHFHLNTCLHLCYPHLLTCIYKSCMSCMSPQFVYQLRLDYYHHSPSACDLSLLPHSISGFRKLFDSCTSAIRLHAQPETSPPHPLTLQLPCDPWDTHTPALIQNTWTATEGRRSTRAEAIVHTPCRIWKPTRPNL